MWGKPRGKGDGAEPENLPQAFHQINAWFSPSALKPSRQTLGEGGDSRPLPAHSLRKSVLPATAGGDEGETHLPTVSSG